MSSVAETLEGLSRSPSGHSSVSRAIPGTSLSKQHRLDLLFRLSNPFFPVLGLLLLAGMPFAGPPLGIGVVPAGITLAVMVPPFIAAVPRDAFEIVPPVLKESAYALGSTTWEVVWNVVLPYTKVGVVGGIMLGLGRALGETMAVTFVIGNAHKLSSSLMMPGNSIASTLANEFTGEHEGGRQPVRVDAMLLPKT